MGKGRHKRKIALAKRIKAGLKHPAIKNNPEAAAHFRETLKKLEK